VFIYKTCRRYEIAAYVILAFVSIVLILATYQITARANSFSWVAGGELNLVDNSERDMNLEPQQCREQSVSINDRPGVFYYESGSTTACVYDAGDWRYALTNQTYKRWPIDQQDVSFALSIGMDSKMYRVGNLHPQDVPVYIPHSKSLAYASTGLGWGRILKIYKDIVSRLTKTDADTYMVGNVDSPDFIFKRPNGSLLPVGKVVSSNNGKWLAFEAVDIGIMRLNLDTYEVKRISSVAPQYGLWGTPHMSLAISDSGEYIAIAGENTPFYIYNVTSECGDNVVTDEMTKGTPISNPCAMRDIGQYLETALPSGLALASSLRLSGDAGEIGFIARLNNDRYGQNQKEYVIQAPGYVPEGRLEYLAMGDSFSSGEGDTQVVHGVKFYLPGTDVEGDDKNPKEKCHISSRSYPFLLQDAMGIKDEKMESIACSGAEVRNDYQTAGDNKNEYKGQGARLAEYEKKLSRLQLDALGMFIPGRLKQMEFIKQYKPQSVTLTGSGNDVGFGSVIQSCIMSNIYPCAYEATESGRAMIAQGIANQFDKLSKLFTEIHSISPSTRVYMVGYPQFIDDKSSLCAPNVPLSQAERTMIKESVTYLNRVIKSAADSSAVKYIDIEDSLKGHRLCESGASYVTGLALARKLGFGSNSIGKSELQESFHPNRNGHILIADAIMNELDSESLLDYKKYPTTSEYQQLARPVDPPEYFTEALKSAKKQYRKEHITLREYIQKVPILNMISIRIGNFKPDSLVKVEVHSDPIELGTYSADSLGNLSVDIPLPINVPAGYHTLHLIGASYSGEEIDVWQTIEVRGSEGDIDEDGILDNVDQCMYVMESGLDEDLDQIDDACDPMIEYEDRADVSTAVDLVAINDEQRDLSAIQTVQDTSRGTKVADINSQIEDIFYLPGSIENNRLIANPHPMTPIQVVLGIFVSSLVLYWVTTRYSNHKDV
jgi:lysophospholipase L1-like esterase